jgi:hypothetical protein
MATRRRQPVKKLKFELSRSAVGGIGLVVFCLFLWMFLLGVWAGQSILKPMEDLSLTEKSEGSNQPQAIKADKKAKKADALERGRTAG